MAAAGLGVSEAGLRRAGQRRQEAVVMISQTKGLGPQPEAVALRQPPGKARVGSLSGQSVPEGRGPSRQRWEVSQYLGEDGREGGKQVLWSSRGCRGHSGSCVPLGESRDLTVFMDLSE